MRKDFNTGQLIFSPSDLITYTMEGEFASFMERAKIEEPKTFKPHMDPVDEMDEALQDKGHEHEAKFFNSLIAKGIDYIEIDSELSDELRYSQTIKAMENGKELIYQGFLQKENFKGNVDFLFKKKGKSKFGDYYYEPYDTKLSRKSSPYMIIQMMCYIEMLEIIQGDVAKEFHLVLGDLSIDTHKCNSYESYYKLLKKSFLDLQKNFSIKNIPDPSKYSTHGRWKEYAQNTLKEREHLSLVARITRNQIDLLNAEGVHTVKELANFTGKIDRIQDHVLERIIDQAKLQLESEGLEKPKFKVLPPHPESPHKGLIHMPPPSKKDIFFDLEGYPLYEDGLEYLWGATYVEDGEMKFIDWWAHNHEEEKIAFENFIDWAYARFQEDPSMHIYHYANYEVAVCKKLMGKYGTREHEVDELLRNHVFVDLYQVVRHGLRIGGPNYSIKTVELIYRGKRANDVANAAASVVYYKNWESSDEGNTPDTSAILKEIYLYNKDDCDSTLELAQWLWDLQKEHNITYVNPDDEQNDLIEDNTEEVRLREAYLQKYSPENPLSNMAWLQEYIKREDKPVHWKRFERLKSTSDELFNDIDCLASITRTEKAPVPEARSHVYEFSYDVNQETRLKDGKSCIVQGTEKGVTVSSIDYDNGIVHIKSAVDLDTSINLIPNDFINKKDLRKRISLLSQHYLDNPNALKPFIDFLNRKHPDIKGVTPSEAIINSDNDLIAETIKAVLNMNHTLLTIQGPPGTGKTHTSASTILELVKKGYRIGITSNSHKAVINLMNKIATLSNEKNLDIHQIKIGGDRKEPKILSGEINFESSARYVDLDEHVNVVGGTAWAFASDYFQGEFDYLFIDEAGQFPLAYLLASCGSCRNIVLMGDQQQLPSVTQGTHVQESGLSCLEYLLQDNATIPADMGILLPTTWRLHPDICAPISKAVYDGRLHPQENTYKRVILPATDNKIITKGHGIKYIPVEHHGNSQASLEELEMIDQVVKELLKSEKTDINGNNLGKMTKKDILIVAPYNHQKNYLEDHFKGTIPIGTVDLFQGQEAHCVILSMCASNLDGAPRGIDFLMDMNRLNVAITRAQSLAIIVASPEIARAKAKNLKQMEQINLYCSLISEDE